MDHTVNFSANPPLTRQAWSPSARRPLLGKFPAWRRGENGVSAVEFALFAPILFFALLATVDLGLALYERMTIDHVLRAGAQAAMADPGAASVLNVLNATAASSFDLANTDLTFAVPPPYHACPENPGVPVPASTTCAGPTSTSIYYRLSATKSYDGLFLPIEIGRFSLGAFTLGSSAQVQIR